jgi:predicted nucleotidyltransferase
MAAEHTAREVDAKKAALADAELSADMSIVLFGSWARDELTKGSDNDWADLVARDFSAYDPEVVRAMALAQTQLGEEEKKPGSQDVFGVPFDIDVDR